MYREFEDEIVLGAEAILSLHYQSSAQGDNEDWDIGHADALESAEREAWARHAARANGFGAAEACFDSDYDDVCTSLHDAIRRVSDMPWD